MPNGGIWHSMSFVVLSMALSVLNEPWALYETFVIEEKHGFNKQTLKGYLIDMAKSQVLQLLIGLPLLALTIWIIESCGDYFYIFLLMFLIAVNFIGAFLYPNFIQPLFNKFTPMEEGPLRHKIESLAGSIGFPLKQLFVVDGSQRSAHSNAYMYGFWKNKRIVLYDTLLEDMKNDDNQLLAVLGHELGHWKLSHTWKLMGIALCQSLNMLYCFKWCHTSNIATSFGFQFGTKKPTLIGLLLFVGFVWSPVDHVFGFLMNILQRRFEHQADEFAVKLGFADSLKSGLIRLNVKNKGTMDPDPLYSTYHHSHPPLITRLRHISDCSKKGT
jgi:STE24 endopeptidase